MLATIVNSCLSAADLSIYHIFSSCYVESDSNVQFFFSFALECRYWINAVFTIFASRANSIQQRNLSRGKYKQIWSNVVFTSYLYWFCSCCESIFFLQCRKHSCHRQRLDPVNKLTTPQPRTNFISVIVFATVVLFCGIVFLNLKGKQNPYAILGHFCTVIEVLSKARHSWKTAFFFVYNWIILILYLAKPRKYN